MVNLLLLLLGLVMDMAPLIVIMTPVLLPLVQSVGMTAEQFGVVMIINLGIGLCTPPVGNALFTGCAVGKTTLEKTTVAIVTTLHCDDWCVVLDNIRTMDNDDRTKTTRVNEIKDKPFSEAVEPITYC